MEVNEISTVGDVAYLRGAPVNFCLANLAKNFVFQLPLS